MQIGRAIKAKEKATFITKRCFKTFSDQKFKNELCTKAWENLGKVSDVNEMVEMYENFVNEALDKHAPVKRIRVQTQYISGISSQTKTLMAQRNSAQKEFVFAN